MIGGVCVATHLRAHATDAKFHDLDLKKIISDLRDDNA